HNVPCLGAKSRSTYHLHTTPLLRSGVLLAALQSPSDNLGRCEYQALTRQERGLKSFLPSPVSNTLPYRATENPCRRAIGEIFLISGRASFTVHIIRPQLRRYIMTRQHRAALHFHQRRPFHNS